jgi:hypothetical protein
MNIKTTIAASSALLAATLFLAGCVAADADPAGPNPTTSPTAPIVEVPETPVGGVIDAETAENLPEGYHGYPMPDGTYVVVAEDEPLPAAVQEKLNADGTYLNTLAQNGDTPEGGNALASSNRAVWDDVANNTGKVAITIAYAPIDLTGNGPVMMWVAWNMGGNAKTFATRGELEAAIAARIADDPNRYVVIWPAV